MQIETCAEQLGRLILATPNADLTFYLQEIAKAEQPCPLRRRLALAIVRNTPSVYAAYLASGGKASGSAARDVFAGAVIDAAVEMIVRGET